MVWKSPAWKRPVRFHPALVLASLVLTLAVTLAPWHSPYARAAASPVAIGGLHVEGNQIVNGAGQPVRLLGVDRSGAEYACIQGKSIFDGPSDPTSVRAIAAWHTSVVRVPLNEDCWLDINGAPAAYSGIAYRRAIVKYVNLLNRDGLAVILDLHWNAPGSTQATGQQPMPDQDHAPAFWTSVAQTFKTNGSVIFDLYNEPYPDSNQDTSAAWTCWRDGGTCPGVGFQAAGMQELVMTVRNTGATNIIMLGGVQYANSLSQWLTYKPKDPDNNLAASWHSYNFNFCTDLTCWSRTIAPVARQVPLIVGEIGENDCAHGYIDQLIPWLDGIGASYLGWTWNPWGCASGPALISDYSGTPTRFGTELKTHFAALAGNPAATRAARTSTGNTGSDDVRAPATSIGAPGSNSFGDSAPG